jgi:hypothetical protein
VTFHLRVSVLVPWSVAQPVKETLWNDLCCRERWQWNLFTLGITMAMPMIWPTHTDRDKLLAKETTPGGVVTPIDIHEDFKKPLSSGRGQSNPHHFSRGWSLFPPLLQTSNGKLLNFLIADQIKKKKLGMTIRFLVFVLITTHQLHCKSAMAT